jgi:hypothetical protein
MKKKLTGAAYISYHYPSLSCTQYQYAMKIFCKFIPSVIGTMLTQSKITLQYEGGLDIKNRDALSHLPNEALQTLQAMPQLQIQDIIRNELERDPDSMKRLVLNITRLQRMDREKLQSLIYLNNDEDKCLVDQFHSYLNINLTKWFMKQLAHFAGLSTPEAIDRELALQGTLEERDQIDSLMKRCVRFKYGLQMMVTETQQKQPEKKASERTRLLGAESTTTTRLTLIVDELIRTLSNSEITASEKIRSFQFNLSELKKNPDYKNLDRHLKKLMDTFFTEVSQILPSPGVGTRMLSYFQPSRQNPSEHAGPATASAVTKETRF